MKQIFVMRIIIGILSCYIGQLLARITILKRELKKYKGEEK